MNKRSFGESIETSVKDHLINKGFNFLAQNWTCPFGEIDLIFKVNSRIVFVEVKFRNSNVLFPEELISSRKLISQVRAIKTYLNKSNLNGSSWQLDYAFVTRVDRKLFLQYFPQVPLEVE